jgi:hypothetical protein
MMVYDHSKFLLEGPNRIFADARPSSPLVLTFSQEVRPSPSPVQLIKLSSLARFIQVERVWKHRFSLASLLFLLNRYCTLIQFIILLTGKFLEFVFSGFCTCLSLGVHAAFQDPRWTGEVRFLILPSLTLV